MTYCLNKNSPISQTQSRLLQLLGKVLPCVTRPLVLKWSTTQVGSAAGPTAVLRLGRRPHLCVCAGALRLAPGPPSTHSTPGPCL